MIEKYIESLLKDNKRVIIPDFGGFVVKRTATGDVISFNAFLKFNDDLLVSTIANGEECSKEQAMKEIEDEVAHINKEIEAQGSYDLKGIGYLVKDKKGNVRFMNELAVEEAPKAEAESKAETKKSETSSKISEADNQEKKVESQDKPKSSTTQVKEEKVVTKQQNSNSIIQHRFFIPGLSALALLVILIIWLVLKPEKVDNIKQGHEELVSEMADKKMEGADKKKGLARFFKKEKKTEKVSKTVVIEEKEEPKPVMQALARDTVRGVVVLADRDISPKGQERYNVIIGSFKEKRNALTLKESLIDDGYGARLFDRYNGWQAVSLGGFPSLDIALMVSGENIQKYPDLWILVK